jgi:lipopolysaccharide export system permease protein
MKIINKYIFRECLTPLLYCFSAFVMLFIIGDLFENLDSFIFQKVPILIILKYYLFFMPNVLILTAPLALLLAILFQLGYMAKHYELVALKASGVSFWKIIMPFVIVGMMLGITLFITNERIVPPCARRLDAIRESYIDKKNGNDSKKQESGGENKNITFFSNKYNLSFYVDRIIRKDVEGASIREFYKDGSLKREWFGKKGVWMDGGWWLFDGYIRQYDGTTDGSGKVTFFKKQEVSINIPPADLIRNQKYKESMATYMSFQELYKYIKRNFNPTNLPREFLIELYRKLSIPVTIIIVTMFGIAFGARISKGGALVSVGYSLSFYIAYYGITSMLLAFGKLGKLTPSLAVWTPHFVFGVFSLYLLKNTK